MVAEDGSVLAPPHLKIAPWADEEGLSLTDYKTGRARVVTPDKRAALTLRCLPLPGEVGKLIEAHPNEVLHRGVSVVSFLSYHQQGCCVWWQYLLARFKIV